MGKEYYSIKDGKIFLTPTLGQEEREIGEVKNSEEETVAYFTKRFDLLRGKIDTLKEKIDTAENKGSFMMKLVHLKESLITYNGLGDFEGLSNELSEIEKSLLENINHNRDRNILIKKDIISKLTPLIESDNWTDDFVSIKELQGHWNKTGKAAEEEEEALTSEFKNKIEQFFKKPVDNLSDLQKELISTRTQEYEFVIEDAEKLLVGKLKNNLKPFKALQDKWKELKEIPAYLYEPLLAKYKEIGDRYFTALKAISNTPNKRPQRPTFNLDVPKEWERITTESEALYDEIDVYVGIKKAKKLQHELKELKKAARKRGFRGEFKVKAAFEYVFEKQYVEYRLRSKNEGFESWDPEKQKKERINTLNYLIQKNEEEIKQIELNRETMVFKETNEDFARMFDSRLTTHLRKLKAKQRLLIESKIN